MLEYIGKRKEGTSKTSKTFFVLLEMEKHNPYRTGCLRNVFVAGHATDLGKQDLTPHMQINLFC